MVLERRKEIRLGRMTGVTRFREEAEVGESETPDQTPGVFQRRPGRVPGSRRVDQHEDEERGEDRHG